MVIRIDEPPPTLVTMEKKKRKLQKGGGIGGDGKKAVVVVAKAGKVESSALVKGMSPAELTMIRRLAGNDPNVRKKTMRKLRKWLSTLVLRFPDDLDSRSDVEPNIIRVWKALFYCMWMADKPLPQEQLAEQISNLVPIVGIKPNILIIFVEWFFRTMAREWNWIDRFRLDKFMMLFRRFIRKTLQTMASRKWSVDLVNGFLRIIKIYVFNHHPEMSTKFNQGTTEPILQCPMGLQLHFIDIFLEELAKSGADGLKPTKVLKFLGPFIEEMATNDDNRVLDALRERIFNHLMRQSDVGIDYQESLMGIDDSDTEEDDLDDDENGEVDDDDKEEAEEEEDDAMGEDDVFTADPGPMDPRAGAVDVILPQLQLDYSILAEKLMEAGGLKTVKKRNRAKLYSLAASFKDLVLGNYPLALPEETSWKPAIPKKDLDKATNRLLELEVEEMGESKVRKTKKQRRRDARKLQQQEQLDDTVGSEDTSAFLNDTNFLDRIDDNYSSYVNEEMNKKGGDEEDEDEDSMDFTDMSPNSKKLKKGKKGQRKSSEAGMKNNHHDTSSEPKLKKKKKYKTVVEFEADELNEDKELSVHMLESPDTVVNIRVPKKKRKSLTLGSGAALKSQTQEEDQSMSKQLNLKRKHKSLSPSNMSLGWALSGKKPLFDSPPSSPPLLTPIRQNDLLRKKLKLRTPTSEGQRRINFALAKNLEHEATDYMPSVSKSPAIPYDATKTPTSGILKSKLARIRGTAEGLSPTKKGRMSLSGTKTSPRKRALDFF